MRWAPGAMDGDFTWRISHGSRLKNRSMAEQYPTEKDQQKYMRSLCACGCEFCMFKVRFCCSGFVNCSLEPKTSYPLDIPQLVGC